ncbi:MAG: helix-turn-helix transcriptional regulator [Spirochaetia bacterium]
MTEKLFQGKSDREIAEALFISPRTVDTHLRNIFKKCSVSSRMQLSKLVSDYGILRN